jgi:hypothetical protein
MSSPKKNQFDLVEKPFNPELVGYWRGVYNFDQIFYLTYIKKNFQKQLHFLPFIRPYIQDYIFEKDSSMGIVDDNKGKGFTKDDNPVDYKKYLSLYKNTKKRFTYFPITLMQIAEYKDGSKDVVAHAISAIYDKQIKEVEIFDSNSLNIKKHESVIFAFMENIYGKDIKIIYIHKCFSLSNLETNRCESIPYKYTSKGFCVIWVLWYLELRLKNRDLSRDQTIDEAINLLKHGPKNAKVCELLRGYAQFVDKTVDKYIVVNKNGKNTLAPNPSPRVFSNSVPATNFNIKPDSIKNNKDYAIALGILSAIIGIGAAVVALRKYYNKRKNKNP